ncbi:unnamed protein product [Lactuca virosa]|uniref:Uncharacterized protein n=1 Tax=Lactuca virosa TaxID=75947 RepID=A0AAU9P5E6_9ASTR|nr:unnamed protein product [Lactuca virosa]
MKRGQQWLLEQILCSSVSEEGCEGKGIGVARVFEGKEARKEFRREAGRRMWSSGVCFDGRRRDVREVRLLSRWLTEAPLQPVVHDRGRRNRSRPRDPTMGLDFC